MTNRKSFSDFGKHSNREFRLRGMNNCLYIFHQEAILIRLINSTQFCNFRRYLFPLHTSARTHVHVLIHLHTCAFRSNNRYLYTFTISSLTKTTLLRYKYDVVCWLPDQYIKPIESSCATQNSTSVPPLNSK